MAHPIESTDVYARACALADEVWRTVKSWGAFDQRTLGNRLVRSLDSIAANLVEGDARGSDQDTARFFVIARASAREARHWLTVAVRRDLISGVGSTEVINDLTEVVKMINGLISHRRSCIVNESPREYDTPEDILVYLASTP